MKFFSGAELEVTDRALILALGELKDYYIAIGLIYRGQYEFPWKKFYWTTNATYKFEAMPPPNEQYKKEVDEREAMFIGEPEKALIEIKVDENAPPVPDPDPELAGGQGKVEEKKEKVDDGPDPKPKPIPKGFTELDRLAYVVAAIENDTHVVPEGAFKLIPVHEIRRNDAFKGKRIKEICCRIG